MVWQQHGKEVRQAHRVDSLKQALEGVLVAAGEQVAQRLSRAQDCVLARRPVRQIFCQQVSRCVAYWAVRRNEQPRLRPQRLQLRMPSDELAKRRRWARTRRVEDM
jgi:hypothetical protein